MSTGHLFRDDDDGEICLMSPCGVYRYYLRRGASHGTGLVNWIMLNPSTADEYENDPTMHRVISYTKSWGYGDLVVTNLFAVRSADPAILAKHPDPIGPENDQHLKQWAQKADVVVCAWGAESFAMKRSQEVVAFVRSIGKTPQVLGFTKEGRPLHPLFKSSKLVTIPWT